MDLHGKIMNIQAGDPGLEARADRAYLLGHRDARHAAAELALEADAQIERLTAEVAQLRDVLAYAEAGLADIGDADREPGDDLAWCERRAADALPRVRAALGAIGAPIAPEHQAELQALSDDAARMHGEMVKDAARYRWLLAHAHYVHDTAWLAGVSAKKDTGCDIFSASELHALLNAEIDKRIAREAMKDTP